jgi:hypothetical protein
MVSRQAMREIIREIKGGRFWAIAVFTGGLLLTMTGGWWLTQWLFEPTPTSPVKSIAEAPFGLSSGTSQSPALSNALAQIQPASEIAQETTTAAKTNSKELATVTGLLRVGNPTEHPVRIAVLLKKPAPKDSANQATTEYEAPAHWDFDPGEGSEKGLLLSLPNRQIKLKKGDILVAFAQDGSRRYWGPYVVGETSTPAWTPKVAEWRLTLQP